jgi:hypothetical protein
MYATGDIVKTRQSAPYDHVPGWRIVDLSRIYVAPITRLGCLAFEGQGAFAPQS